MKLKKHSFEVSKPIDVRTFIAELQDAGVQDPKVSFISNKFLHFYELKNSDIEKIPTVIEAHKHPIIVSAALRAPLVTGEELRIKLLTLPSVTSATFVGGNANDSLWVKVNPGADHKRVRQVIEAHIPDVLSHEKDQAYRAANGVALVETQRGFFYKGIVHSVSTYAQLNWHHMLELDRMDTLAYPVRIPSRSDSDETILADSSELQDFCRAGMLFILSAVQMSNSIKAQVRAASTVEETKATYANLPPTGKGPYWHPKY